MMTESNYCVNYTFNTSFGLMLMFIFMLMINSINCIKSRLGHLNVQSVISLKKSRVKVSEFRGRKDPSFIYFIARETKDAFQSVAI